MRKWWLKLVWYLGLVVVLTYATYGWLIFQDQTDYVYHPNGQTFENCPAFAEAEKVVVNDTRMYYQYVSGRVAVHYHGNASSACQMTVWRDLFVDRGWSYVIVEYTGFGGDERTPGKALILEDVIQVQRFLEELPVEELLVVGESIGCGPASYQTTLASYDADIKQVDRLVCFTGYSSVADVAQSQLTVWYPLEWLLTENYTPAVWLENYQGRFVLIHGTADSVLPYELGVKLYEAVPEDNKQLVTVAGGQHGDLLRYPEVVETLEKVLD
jgi:hypothetical protein